MKIKTSGLIIAAAALLSLTAVSCTRYTASDFYGGESVSPGMISEIEDKLNETTAEKYPAVTDAEGRQIFFWTPSGTVFHRSESCPRLSSSAQVVSGTQDEALEAGKTRGCSVCCKGQ